MVRVVDGDTADVRLDSGEDLRVRILGIDTPETVKSDAAVQCWGPEASAWAHTMLDDAAVTLTGDPRTGDVDRYGRSRAVGHGAGVRLRQHTY
ncbi:micrococcal nuclease-like nuclease [Mycobacteroides abscessus subsp. abscessus]|nr:micrococcal nuclease-like nuclease [Mycobacteroides abscessus subsp. abscessus]